ncbi:MAG: hypothetical protein WA417_03045, partial [Stellaceae bacterium]
AGEPSISSANKAAFIARPRSTNGRFLASYSRNLSYASRSPIHNVLAAVWARLPSAIFMILGKSENEIM